MSKDDKNMDNAVEKISRFRHVLKRAWKWLTAAIVGIALFLFIKGMSCGLVFKTQGVGMGKVDPDSVVCRAGDEYKNKGTFETTDLIVDNTSSLNGRIIFKPCDAGLLATQTIFSNWSPSCLATNTLITVEAGDNSGNFITGIDAVGKSLPIGSKIKLCNNGGHMDASSLILTNLDSRSSVGNRILTPGAGAQRFCSVTNTTPCQANSDCPGGETCVAITANYAIGTDECAELEYIHPTAAPTWSEWVVQGKARTMTAVVGSLNIYPVLFTDDLTGTVDSYNPTCSTPACVAAHAYVCNPGGINCGEAGDDLTFAGNTTILISTSTGATIAGFHYDASPTNINGLGPYKIIRNLGPGNLTIKNNASAISLDSINDGANGDTRGDIVLLQGQSMGMFHLRETGGWFVEGKRDAWFHERDVWMNKGLDVQGRFDNGFSPSEFTVDNTSLLNSSGSLEYIRDNGTYDTTPGSITTTGLSIQMAATRSLGAPSFFQIGLDINAASATAVRSDAIRVEGGNTYLGYGNTSSQTEMSGNTILEKKVFVGGGDFAGTTTQQILSADVAPTINHGGLSSDSSNFIGEVTSVGAFTSVTLTFGSSGFPTSSHCIAQTEGSGIVAQGIDITPSKTAPIFNCFTLATGVAANCPNFTYQCWGH